MSFVPRDHLEKLPSPAFYEILDVADELRAEGFCVRRRARKFLLCRARGNPMSDDGMTKYGVDESDDEKAASVAPPTTRCPSCGNEVEVHGRTRICPQCGSKPFEPEDPETARDGE